jgi:hypothetical protein
VKNHQNLAPVIVIISLVIGLTIHFSKTMKSMKRELYNKESTHV